MTTTLERVLASRPNDLPPAWDGIRIEWGAWSAAQTSLRFHAPLRDLACQKCGQVDQERHVARGAREGVGPGEGRLTAFRCPGCGHDEVWDHEADTWWDLDPSDYLDEGSTPEGTLW